jgi:LCP family protein required for cell wall assembly
MANGVGKFSSGWDIKSAKTSLQYSKTTDQSTRNTNHQPKILQIAKLPPKPKRLSPFQRGLLWGAIFSLTSSVSATFGAALAIFEPLSLNLSAILRHPSLPWQTATSEPSPDLWEKIIPYHLSRPINILVMGIDRVPNARLGSLEAISGRSDTLLLLRFNPSDRSLRILSIPRDSRVEIPGVGFAKINDANVRGGPALAEQVVSKTLNEVAIDRYVRVTTDAFKELIDLVGGVEVFVPHPMSYTDMTQKLNINLEAGWQTLNGEQAEQFARFRKDRYGDIGRVQRQQILLKALEKRLYQPTILPRLPEITRLLHQYVDTNLTLEEILGLVNFGRSLRKDDIKMVMLPGRFSQVDEYDASYWLISSRGRDRVMQEYFDLKTGTISKRSPQHLRVAIQNATDNPDLTHRIVNYLASHNIHNVHLLQDSLQLLPETEIIVQQGDLEAAKTLKSVLGTGRVEASSTGDLDSDLTIRVGGDIQSIMMSDSFLKQ